MSSNVIKDKDMATAMDRLKLMPEFVDKYVNHLLSNGGSPSTVLGYLIDYEIFFSWLMAEGISDASTTKDITIDELEKLHVDEVTSYRLYLQHYRGNKSKTRGRKLSSLKSLFHYLSQIAEDENLYPILKRNVMAKIDIGTTNTKPDINKLRSKLLLEDEINEFIDFVRSGYRQKIENNKQALYSYEQNSLRDAAIISFILGSGLRVSEVVNCNLDDLNLKDQITTIIGKGQNDEGESVGVLFSPQAKDDLERYLEIREAVYNPEKNEKAVFLAIQNGESRGNRMSRRAMQAIVIKYAKAFGKTTTIHKLRQSFATEYNRHNGIHKTKNQLRHKKFETTEIYALVSDKEMIDAINRV
ncbi:tyrosine recombinase XerS [Paenibacillus taichungensis]